MKFAKARRACIASAMDVGGLVSRGIKLIGGSVELVVIAVAVAYRRKHGGCGSAGAVVEVVFTNATSVLAITRGGTAVLKPIRHAS